MGTGFGNPSFGNGTAWESRPYRVGMSNSSHTPIHTDTYSIYPVANGRTKAKLGMGDLPYVRYTLIYLPHYTDHTVYDSLTQAMFIHPYKQTNSTFVLWRHTIDSSTFLHWVHNLQISQRSQLRQPCPRHLFYLHTQIKATEAALVLWTFRLWIPLEQSPPSPYAPQQLQ